MGSVIAVTALAAWRQAVAPRPVGAQVTVAINRSGPLRVQPAGTLITTSDLRAATSASGHTTITNLTNRTQHLGVRLAPVSRELDETLGVDLHINGQPLLDGPLAALLQPTRPFELDPAQSATLDIRVSIAPMPPRRYQGRLVDATIELVPTPRANQ